MTRPLVVVGDTLLDRDIEGAVERLCPDAPVPVVDERSSMARAGGAGLAASLLRADGRWPVTLVTALSDDRAGRRAAELLRAEGVDVVAIPQRGAIPEKIRVRSAGRTLLRVDRGGQDMIVGPASRQALATIREAAGVLIADYGNGVAAQAGIRKALTALAAHQPVVWDPHPKGAEPVPGCRLVTPNRREATGLTEVEGTALSADIERARQLRERWQAHSVAVTLGEQGALVVDASGTPLRIPAGARAAPGTDPCGAGDRFAATAAAVLTDGGLLSDAATAAVRAASRFVADGGAAALRPVPADGGPAPASEEADAVDLARRVRERGGTVVATGGCFDLLHAGHVQTLESARSLGDCLIVCLNSDESVRARKGPGRPLLSASDRAVILRGLRCVDAVAVFDEPTPEKLLEELRPHVWAKGADYTIADLPEAPTVASWGGETVVLPYLDGRSTTALLKEAFRDA